ncbi:hypothetical protein JCM14036_33490 [Desulfotomaculum defluvii]
MLITALFILIAGFALYFLVAPEENQTETILIDQLHEEVYKNQCLYRGQGRCLAPRQHLR